jgi:6-pyruvoyltetrahydropterin/6-carboxytetrahydropterin synthase
MYILKTQGSFDAAHFLSGYNGKCKNIHGHRWTVEIKIKAESLSEDIQSRGMIVDFSVLKQELLEMTDYFDHSLILEKGTLKEKTLEALREEDFRLVEVDFRPTAENFARFFYDSFKEKGFNMLEAVVYETPNNAAVYCE